MSTVARFGALVVVLTIACGPASETGGDGGASDHPRRDGGGAHERDAGSDHTLGGTCGPTDQTWRDVAPFGLGEGAGFDEGPFPAMVASVNSSSVVLDIDGRERRFDWPAAGLESLSVGMEVELSYGPHWSRLVAPDVTLHAVYVNGRAPPLEPFGAPIEVAGAPALWLVAECTMVDEWNFCGEDLVTRYVLDTGEERLHGGEDASGPGYAVHFRGATRYPGGEFPDGCISEPWDQLSFGVRVDRKGEPGP